MLYCSHANTILRSISASSFLCKTASRQQIKSTVIFVTQILISIMSLLILQVESKAFSSLNAARSFLTTLDLEKKYSTQKQIVDQLNSLHQNVKDALVNFFDYVIRDRFWASFLITAQFKKNWRSINRVVAEARRERNRLQEVKNSILRRWEDVAASELQNRSYHHLNQLRKMFMTMTYAETRKLITVRTSERV
jgi:hypothetical protein